MSGYFWNNGWAHNYQLGSCPDLLLRSVFALSNVQEAGKVAFNGYYFGPASTGALSGSASISFSQAGAGGTVGTNTKEHFWNNSWLLSDRLGSCPDALLRQLYALSNTNEIGAKAFNAYYFGLVSGAIVGAASITFTESGALIGAGVLTGTSTIVFTETGTLLGAGAIRGSSTVIFTESGSLGALVNIQGSTTIVFTEAGTIQGLIEIIGSSTVAFTESGSLHGSGAAIGTATITFTESGTPRGAGALIGTLSIVFSESATIYGIGALDGSSSIIFTESGDLIAFAFTEEVFFNLPIEQSFTILSPIELTTSVTSLFPSGVEITPFASPPPGS